MDPDNARSRTRRASSSRPPSEYGAVERERSQPSVARACSRVANGSPPAHAGHDIAAVAELVATSPRGKTDQRAEVRSPHRDAHKHPCRRGHLRPIVGSCRRPARLQSPTRLQSATCGQDVVTRWARRLWQRSTPVQRHRRRRPTRTTSTVADRVVPGRRSSELVERTLTANHRARHGFAWSTAAPPSRPVCRRGSRYGLRRLMATQQRPGAGSSATSTSAAPRPSIKPRIKARFMAHTTSGWRCAAAWKGQFRSRSAPSSS
jgi:hypothetical protein